MREREQYWINLLNPEYNLILKVDPYANSALKSKGHPHNVSVRKKLSLIAKNRLKDPNPGFSIQVKNIEIGEIKKYKSVREAARDLKCDTKSLRVRILTDYDINKNLLLRRKNVNKFKYKLFRKKYLILLNDINFSD